MPTFDGAAGPAYYREWLVPQPRATVVLAHGVGEHAGLYDRYAGHLGRRGISLRALDQIGHGRSAGSPDTGRWGVITSADDLVADIQQLTSLAAAADPGVPLILQGHSLGAIMGSRGRHPAAGSLCRGGAVRGQADRAAGLPHRQRRRSSWGRPTCPRTPTTCAGWRRTRWCSPAGRR